MTRLHVVFFDRAKYRSDLPASGCEPRNRALRANEWIYVLRVVDLNGCRCRYKEYEDEREHRFFSFRQHLVVVFVAIIGKE